MATIIWCDRARHIVEESRTEVERLLLASWHERAGEDAEPSGFIYFTPVNSPTQRALRVSAITSFEAVPGDGL